MRDHVSPAIMIVGMIVTSGRAWPQQAQEPALGVGPETFDWNAGVESAFSFLSSIPVLAIFLVVLIAVARSMGSAQSPIGPTRQKPSLPTGT